MGRSRVPKSVLSCQETSQNHTRTPWVLWEFVAPIGRYFNVVTVLSRNGVFFGKKFAGSCVCMIWSWHFILESFIGWSICSKKNYGNLTLLHGYIVPWCPKIMGFLWSGPKCFFFRKKKMKSLSLYAVNYKQNSQNTNTFCFSFISSNNVEIWLKKEFLKV